MKRNSVRAQLPMGLIGPPAGNLTHQPSFSIHLMSPPPVDASQLQSINRNFPPYLSNIENKRINMFEIALVVVANVRAGWWLRGPPGRE